MKTAVTKNSEKWKNDTEHAYRLHCNCHGPETQRHASFISAASMIDNDIVREMWSEAGREGSREDRAPQALF